MLGAVLVAAGSLWQGGLSGPGLPVDRVLPPLTAATGPTAPPLRLAVFGTSLTAGSRWPEATAAALERCLDRPVVLIRRARPGAGSAWGRTETAQLAANDPDIVLIEFAINDADLRDGIGLATARANHLAILAALAASRSGGMPEVRLVLMTMSPAEGLRGLLRPGLGRHYAAYRTLAAETGETGMGAGLVDLYSRWRALPQSARGLTDGLHPEDAVAQAVILPVLVPYLARLAGGACT